MADLIDRAKLFTERMPIHEGDPLARLNEVLKRLRNAPAVDAVEVVRCKNCLYYNTFGCSPGFGWCEHFDRGEFDEHYCYGADMRGE